ncbi:Egl nine 1, partial [Globisporangium splendens]
MRRCVNRVAARVCPARVRSAPFSSAAPSHADAVGAWPRVVTPEMTQSLLQNGYFVVRDAFPKSYLRALKREIAVLRDTDQLYPNATHILLKDEQQPTLLQKHHILETELALDTIHVDQVPTLRAFFDDQVVFAPLQRALPAWLGLSGYMVKLQYNEGHGGCFPLHFDSYGEDGKCVTAVLYLNDGWQDGDGGEIVLYPFPKQKVVIAPRFGDMVLFSSQQMLHRVMPATMPRYCLTTWTYQSPMTASAAAERAAYYRRPRFNDEASDSKSAAFYIMMEKVLASSFRRHLMKRFYADEWTRSLHESHAQTEAFAKYMATHEHEMGAIDAATTQMLRNFRAKDPVQPSTLPATCDELAEVLLQDSQREFVNKLQLAWF